MEKYIMTTINNIDGLLIDINAINLKLYNEPSRFLANDLNRVSRGLKELECIYNFLANEQRFRLKVKDGEFVLETTWSSQKITPEFLNELEAIMTKIPTLNNYLTNSSY
jgi:hypothetical protein